MEAARNERTGIWHLVGARGCGVDPASDAYEPVISGTWAEVRDHVDRDPGERCQRCRWPPG